MTTENFLFKMLERAAERMQDPKSDPKDTITMDVPLFVRMLELAREDIKTDVELHQVVERTLALKNKGVLTMDDYSNIAGQSSNSANVQQEPVQNKDDELAELRRLAGMR